MKKLKVVWSYDEHDCETCGHMWSSGAVVTLDDEVILDEPASCSCFHSVDIHTEDVLKALCDKLGIKIEEIHLDDKE